MWMKTHFSRRILEGFLDEAADWILAFLPFILSFSLTRELPSELGEALPLD